MQITVPRENPHSTDLLAIAEVKLRYSYLKQLRKKFILI